MRSIVVAGSINADLIARVTAQPSPGQTIMGKSLTVLAGGKGANQAVAAAQLGAKVALVGAVGDDSFAETALAGLRQAGVDLQGVTQVPGATGLALIQVSDDGENSIVVIPGANAAMDAEAVTDQRELIAGAEVVVLQGEIPADGIEAAARLARKRVVLNLAPVTAIDPAVIRRSSPLVVNEHEGVLALELLGAPVPKDQRAIAAALLAAGVQSVVVTLGAAGALVGEGDLITAVPSPKVAALDTTGAGDAFTGALAFALAAGDDLVTAAGFAARVGAYTVTGHGAQASYPWADTPLP